MGIMATTHATPEAWIGSLWMRGYGNGLVLLHNPQPATTQDMRDAGIPSARAGAYVAGYLHGTGYRGLYLRDYIVEEVCA
jgi:hypothetical protein